MTIIQRIAPLPLLILLSMVVLACGGPTRGPVPDSAIGPNGELRIEQVPDFVSVAGHNDGEILGYIDKRILYGPETDQPMPVVGEDLRTQVGWMIPGKGFVPLGEDPASVPNVPATTADGA